MAFAKAKKSANANSVAKGTAARDSIARGTRASMDDLLQLRLVAKGLDVMSRHTVVTSLAGGHRAAIRGRGIDFEELRHYQPGDDVRSMDWRVTARSNAPHIKVYREERERPVFVVVDQGSTMQFGSVNGYKSVAALHAAALLAWSIIGHGDRVGGAGFGGKKEFFCEPTAGRRGVLRLLKQLLNQQLPENGARSGSLQSALKQVRRVARPGSLILVLSDFHSLDDEATRQLLLLRRHTDVVAAWVNDPLERQVPPPGQYSFVSGDGEIRKIDLSKPGPRSECQRQLDSHYRELTATCRKLGIHLFSLSNNESTLESLRTGLSPTRKVGLTEEPSPSTGSGSTSTIEQYHA